MAEEKKIVRVAIVGLGRVGSVFLERLSEKEGSGLNIVACAEKRADAQGVEIAKNKGIPVYTDTKEIVAMGEDVDVIFDLTGNAEARKNLRGELARSGNQHTVIAPEVIAYLLWDLMGETEALPQAHDRKGY